MMNELHMTISTKTLLHVANVLTQADDQAVIEVEPDGILCRLMHSNCARMVIVKIPATACASYRAGRFKANVNLKSMKAILDATPEVAGVEIVIFNDWICLRIGMHNLSQKLTDPSKIRQPKNIIDFTNTTMMRMSGTFLKQIVKYSKSIGASELEIDARRHNVVFTATSTHDQQDYACVVDWDSHDQGNVRAKYSTEYLSDITSTIADENVYLRIGGDQPIEIYWTHGGCSIKHILAPRVEL